MSFEKRAAFVELARGDMYKHMFYAARNGSTAGSATEGNKKGDITDKTIMCRYDRFVDILSGLPADAARRALEDPSRKISYRDELWNTHKGTGTQLPTLKRTYARTHAQRRDARQRKQEGTRMLRSDSCRQPRVLPASRLHACGGTCTRTSLLSALSLTPAALLRRG